MIRRPHCLALLALLLALPASAQERGRSKKTKKTPPDETGGRSKKTKKTFPQPVPKAVRGRVYETVVRGRRGHGEGPSVRKIRRHEVERQVAQSVAQVLEQEPSIHVASGSRGERTFTLRGFSQRQVVVLVDGAPSYIPYDGQVDLNMVPAELVHQITIIKGPGSVLYGPNGMGGAVNIVTRRPGIGPLGEVLVEAGRSGFLQLRGFHTHRLGPLAYAVHGGLSREDDFPLSARFAPAANENGVLRQNSDRRSYHLGTRLSLPLGTHHRLDAGVVWLDGEHGLPPSIHDRTPKYWRFSVWRALNLSVGHSASYRLLELDELLFVSLFDNQLDSFDDGSFTTQDSPRAFSSWYHDQIFGGRVRGRYRTEALPWPTSLQLWAGVHHDRHQRDELAAYSRTIVTAAPELELQFTRSWSLVAALQLDLELPDQQTHNQLGLGPLLSVRFQPNKGLWLQATAARRGRFPTLKERFSGLTGARRPNPDLRPESTWNFGLEGSWRIRRELTLSAALFESEVSDLIDPVAVGGGEFQMQNVHAARLLGAELSLVVNPTRWLRLDAGYGLLHARRTDADPPHDELQYRPAHKAALRLLLAPWPRWGELTSQLRVVGPQRFTHPETLAQGTLGAYLVWDARLTLTPRSWCKIWISARNITDANYQPRYGFPDPGRQLWLGARVSYERD